jgi:hypothetical protein
MRFFRYFCAYCFSRIIFNAARAALRRPAVEHKPCKRHGRGLLLTLWLLAAADPVGLIVLGFYLK